MKTYQASQEELEILQSSYKEAKTRIDERLAAIDHALRHGTIGPSVKLQSKKRRTLSAKARASIAKAQRKRWAAVRKAKAVKKPKTMAAGA